MTAIPKILLGIMIIVLGIIIIFLILAVLGKLIIEISNLLNPSVHRHPDFEECITAGIYAVGALIVIAIVCFISYYIGDGLLKDLS